MGKYCQHLPATVGQGVITKRIGGRWVCIGPAGRGVAYSRPMAMADYARRRMSPPQRGEQTCG